MLEPTDFPDELTMRISDLPLKSVLMSTPGRYSTMIIISSPFKSSIEKLYALERANPWNATVYTPEEIER